MSPLRIRTIRGYLFCLVWSVPRSIFGAPCWSIRVMQSRSPKAIAQALAMPLEERHARHQALLAVVSDYDVDRWQTAGVPDRSAGREWELARAAKLTSDSRFTVGKADKPLFESERRRRAWFARLTPVLGAGAIIMASANVVAVVQSKKARGRATDSSGLRSAETAKNHAINPAAIINAAPSR
jgi:hypothetical protein